MTSTKWMLIALMMAGVLIVTAAQTAPPQQAVLPVGSAVVTEVKGEVAFISPQGAPLNAPRGTILTAESKIETAKGSVLLELQDGSQVLVKGHSSVVLKAPNEGKGFFLEQFLGQIIVKAQKRMGETPSFRMGTPSAVITVRGTRFLVEVNKKHKTYVNVFEGVVEVEGLMPGSPHVLIKPGFFSGVDPDRAPEQPRETNSGEDNGKNTGREGQNSRAERSSGDQQKSQPKQSEGKPD
jgi:ferric-dicitrate binding protein FerR (iron transport regulator)